MTIASFTSKEERVATDVYLQIDGTKGESQDSAHRGWIEVTSAQWGVVQPRERYRIDREWPHR
ncbi:type VI protein secretion system component Hcp [Massilia sp. UYP11]